mmetsp:Transcript_18572/g.70241  ORF Transcript_18572/g.70241 Transcript_18572/m.70241 type:complete len:214 (+) Transcript_18572:975-1616(+)
MKNLAAGVAWSTKGGYGSGVPGGDLLALGMGWHADKSRNPTVIYNNWLSKGSPQPPPPSVASYLRQNGVRFLLSGHQPHGDMPLIVVETFEDGSRGPVTVITADTSYSRNTRWEGTSAVVAPEGAEAPPGDTRGVAVAEILIALRQTPTKASRARVHGVLSDGTPYDFEIDEKVGFPDRHGWWIKGHGLTDRPGLLVTRSSGYDVTNKVVNEG